MLMSTFIIGVPAGGKLQVEEKWAVRYNGPVNGDDTAYAMAVDQSSGNIYVTGHSENSGTYYDIVTLAYDSSGNELWAARYDGPVNDFDSGHQIALDSSGNIYVTGISQGDHSLNPYDYATIAYDPSGNQLWAARYNGPARSTDVPYGIATDEENVYVTGFSHGGFTHQGGTEADFATISYYRSNGTQRWVTRFNGPGNNGDVAHHMILDASGNVIVFGDSEKADRYKSDLVTIAYYPSNGTQKWIAIYDGPNDIYDRPVDLTADPQGNVIITAWSEKDLTNKNITTVKYDENGNELWVATYNGPQNDDDTAMAMCTDIWGNIYVTGFSYVNSTNRGDYTTIAYSPLGDELWEAQYNGPESGRDYAVAIACDLSGNVFVTGCSKGIGTEYDYATVIYDSNGNELWVGRYNGPADYIDWAADIGLDSSGNIYVTGRSYTTTFDSDIATIKYSYTIPPPQVNVDIDPDTLNLKSKGRWITCYIEMPDVSQIDISTIMLEDVIPAEWGDIQGDTLMVKFDRSEVEDMLVPGTYNLKVTGELLDGTGFEGFSDEVRVIHGGD
jgi:hypothetical protein